jgi:branched-chain amino acid aminotransferase
MKIKISPAKKLKKRPTDESKLGFGSIFTDHMFLMDYEIGKGWFDPRIVPYKPLRIDPAAMALHYGQEIFEGLKAYGGKDNGIYLFRPKDNFARLNRSAARVCIPEVDIDFAMEAIKKLVLVDKKWVPRSEGTSLYIRPAMIATEPHLGVRAATTYLFYIIAGPVGAYYKGGLKPIRIYVEEFYIRAAPGGTGEVKTAGNYAASLLAAKRAKEKGFDQVMWLDAIHHRYVEEVGAMNMFFVINDELITPALSGSILAGITRDSVIRMARDWGANVSERPVSIEEIIEAAKQGRLSEAFGTGTAAVISPVGELCYKGESWGIADGRIGDLSLKLYQELVAYQYGEKEDPYGWVERIH